MRKAHRWLLNEVEIWLAEGLIDPRQAEALRERYHPEPEAAWGRLVLSALGAAIFGLGVILFFAYNWEAMPKGLKLVVVFGGLLGAHGAAIGWSRRARSGALVEGLHVLGTMLFGAGIWLVAQIYHIDDHYPNAFLAWGLGALALAWALPSVPQGLLAVALMVIWSSCEALDFERAHHLGAVVVLAGAFPLAWQRRSPVLTAATATALLFLLGTSSSQIGAELVLFTLLATAGLYVGAARLAPGSSFPASAAPLSWIGHGVFFFLLFLLSFGDVADDLLEVPEPAWHWAYLLVPLAAALAANGLALVRRSAARPAQRLELTLVVFTLITAALVHTGLLDGEDWLLALPFNGVLAIFSVSLIVDGSKRLDGKRVGLGCVLLSAQTIARFLDLFESLLARSVVFLLLGAGLFAVGNAYARRKRRQEVDGA